jgi:hypothetical protein
MRVTPFRVPLLLLALFVAVPMFAAIAADVTIPVAGHALGANDLNYRTELTITNYRNVQQYVQLALIIGGHESVMAIFPMQPLETKFLPTGGFASSSSPQNDVIAGMRLRALVAFEGAPDPEGQIEANAFIVGDRGRFAKNGSSRQEVAGIPSSEYRAEEAVFLGVRHSLGTGAYTNVGIVNMATTTETFYVKFQFAEPVAVVVPPLSLRQIRLPGEGNGGRWVQVYPEWSIGDGPPARTTEWVAYASTIDTQTGDAFSGMRVPAATRFTFPGGPDLP